MARSRFTSVVALLLAAFAVFFAAPVHAEDAGAAAPIGWRYEERPARGWLIAGASSFAAGYLLPLTVAYVFAPSAQHMPGDCGGPDCRATSDLDSDRGWLFVPVAGPAIWYSKHESTETAFWWYAFSAAQAAGIAMTIYAFASPSKTLVRGDVAIVPSPAPGGGTVTVVGVF